MKVKSESEVAQSCPTLSGPMDCSLPGSSIHGIFQARVLEWGAVAFSVGHFSSVQFFATLWTIGARLFCPLEFSRQEYWSGLPCPPPGYLFDPEIKSKALISPALAGGFFTTSTTWEAPYVCQCLPISSSLPYITITTPYLNCHHLLVGPLQIVC